MAVEPVNRVQNATPPQGPAQPNPVRDGERRRDDRGEDQLQVSQEARTRANQAQLAEEAQRATEARQQEDQQRSAAARAREAGETRANEAREANRTSQEHGRVNLTA